MYKNIIKLGAMAFPSVGMLWFCFLPRLFFFFLKSVRNFVLRHLCLLAFTEKGQQVKLNSVVS